MSLYLNKIQDIFGGPRDLQIADLESLMLNIRLVLEAEDLKEKYKILNLYCNWCMHSSIEESITAYRILENITQSIISNNQDPENSKWIHDAIIEGLKFHQLQYEILDFIDHFNLDIKMFSEDGFWKGFGAILIHNLIERPIRLNNKTNKKKLKEILERIITMSEEKNQLQFAVFSLEFIYINLQQFFRILTGIAPDKQTEILGELYTPTYQEFLKHNPNSTK